MRMPRVSGVLARSALLSAATFASGCAVHYFDAKTGTEHIWGFGHMRMKATVDGAEPQAVVSGVETAGVTVGVGSAGTYLNVGLNRRDTTQVAAEGTNVRMEWPEGDFYQLEVEPSNATDETVEAPPKTDPKKGT